MHIQNAIIESISIDDAERGMLTAWLHLKLQDGFNQGFGGYDLYLPKSYKNHDILSHAGHFIFRCMEVAGVSKWSDLKGKTIRIKHDKTGLGANIIAIGHIIKDDWFNPSEDFKTD